MNLVNQGESSGGLSVQPEKRRRGRPRKDPSLKHTEAAAHRPLGFEGVKENPPQRADTTKCMVGQAVTGVVEAVFESGYMLNVRIGNSNTNLRGVVFKGGHYVPITAENDVAPHVQMIRRNDVNFTVENQGWSCGHQGHAMQTAPMVPAKRKYAPRKPAPSIPPPVVPAVLQSVGSPSGVQTSSGDGDKNVHVVEPLSMLPPGQSIPVGHQVAVGNEQNDDGSFNEGISEFGQEEKPKAMISTDVDTSGSSQMSDIKIEDGKEALKSSGEDLGVIVSKQEIRNTNNEPFSTDSSQAACVTKPLFNYGTGRMTELLQALQENIKDTQMQNADEPSSATEVESHQTMTTETTDPKTEASVP
ncbi:hypothetical protein DH2020_016818 [Rehmannia glutinosa]|uniref:AT hook motif-containing protein n=1 Tax=Rehmannia glutinosa TaxID=99300 RepID=A0ABR0WP11_REHGL